MDEEEPLPPSFWVVALTLAMQAAANLACYAMYIVIYTKTPLPAGETQLPGLVMLGVFTTVTQLFLAYRLRPTSIKTYFMALCNVLIVAYPIQIYLSRRKKEVIHLDTDSIDLFGLLCICLISGPQILFQGLWLRPDTPYEQQLFTLAISAVCIVCWAIFHDLRGSGRLWGWRVTHRSDLGLWALIVWRCIDIIVRILPLLMVSSVYRNFVLVPFAFFWTLQFSLVFFPLWRDKTTVLERKTKFIGRAALVASVSVYVTVLPAKNMTHFACRNAVYSVNSIFLVAMWHARMARHKTSSSPFLEILAALWITSILIPVILIMCRLVKIEKSKQKVPADFQFPVGDIFDVSVGSGTNGSIFTRQDLALPPPPRAVEGEETEPSDRLPMRKASSFGAPSTAPTQRPAYPTTLTPPPLSSSRRNSNFLDVTTGRIRFLPATQSLPKISTKILPLVQIRDATPTSSNTYPPRPSPRPHSEPPPTILSARPLSIARPPVDSCEDELSRWEAKNLAQSVLGVDPALHKARQRLTNRPANEGRASVMPVVEEAGLNAERERERLTSRDGRAAAFVAPVPEETLLLMQPRIRLSARKSAPEIPTEIPAEIPTEISAVAVNPALPPIRILNRALPIFAVAELPPPPLSASLSPPPPSPSLPLPPHSGVCDSVFGLGGEEGVEDVDGVSLAEVAIFDVQDPNLVRDG